MSGIFGDESFALIKTREKVVGIGTGCCAPKKCSARHRGPAEFISSAALLVLVLSLMLMPLPNTRALAAPHGGSGRPFGLEVSPPDSSEPGCLLLTWRVEDIFQVGSFAVYRSADRGRTFRRVYSSPVNMRIGSRMDYVDLNLEPGKEYVYRVAHYDRSGRELGLTDTVRVKAQGTRSRGAAAYPGKRIIISIAEQRIYFLENDVIVRSHLCSTGVDSHPTPLGVFKVLYHQYLLVSERYGGVYCYWWMGFAPDTGMHAIPYNPKTRTWIGASMLGRKASHGCVRQAVADAEWAYKWAPDGTRIDVIPQAFMPPQPPPETPKLKGGHSSQGISQLSKEWYFAEGYTGRGFKTYILIMNPNHEAATVNAEYMKPDGSTLVTRYEVKPLSRFTINLNRTPGLEESEVSTRLESDIPIAAERAMYFDYMGRMGGTGACGVTSPGNTWYLAEGYTGTGFDEYILFQNPGSRKARARVTFMLQSGERVKKVFSISPRSRFTLKVNDIPEATPKGVSTLVESDVGIIVERAQYFEYAGRDGGSSSAGVKKLSKKWYLAEGYTGAEFDEYILIQNPTRSTGVARVLFMRSDGELIEQVYELSPTSRFTIHVDEIPGLENAEVSAVVEADVDVVVERAIYFVSYGRPGGTDSPGVTEPSRYWYLAEGYTGGEFDTYVLILNPNNEPVDVDVNYLMQGGEIKATRYRVDPLSRYTIHVDSTEGLSNAEFSTALTGSLPIVCERAMYFAMAKE